MKRNGALPLVRTMRLINDRVVRRFRKRRALQRDYHAYAARMTPKFVDGWMIQDLCRRLQRFSEAVRRRESPRLAISMPPRRGKSLFGVKNFVPWHLGHAPGDEIIVASYGMRLAQDMTRAARAVLKEPVTSRVFPDLELSKDAAEKADWMTTVRGGTRATGAGGAITGRGADILIVDDAFKDHREALSARVRDDRWNWYGTTGRSRVSPGGGVLQIGTRWHKRDLISRCLDEYAHENWEVVNYSAIAEQDEYHPETGELLRREGELLDERWTMEQVDAIRRGLPRLWWLALYMGRPTDPEGEVWQRSQWRRWTVGPVSEHHADIGWMQRPSRFDRITLSVDLTFGSVSDSASYSVIQRWGRAGDSVYLLGEWRKRCPYPEQRAKLLDVWKANPGCRVVLEDKATGKPMRDELKNIIRDLVMYNPTPHGDKVARARAVEPIVANGQVFIPADLEHGGPDPSEVPDGMGVDMVSWMDEVGDFPGAAADDRVDTATQLIRHELIDNANTGRIRFGLARGGRG